MRCAPCVPMSSRSDCWGMCAQYFFTKASCEGLLRLPYGFRNLCKISSLEPDGNVQNPKSTLEHDQIVLYIYIYTHTLPPPH